MPSTTNPRLPIGYWLKQADNLITKQVNEIQAANGLTRPEWQVLNTLYEVGPTSSAQIFEVMRTFVDQPELEAILTRLAARGWAEAVAGAEDQLALFQLTGTGQQHHRAMLQVQQQARQRTMQGISDEEYATTMKVLQQIVKNLTDDSDQMANQRG